MTTETTEDYKRLLDALAGFVVGNQDSQLDAFMTGYIGDEWAKAISRAWLRRTAAERRLNEPMLWD